MATACIMRNGSVYNPTPQLPGLEDEFKESVSPKSVSKGKEAKESANENVQAKGRAEEKDSVSTKSKSK